MKLLVDIDNTICITEGSNYKNSVPIQNRIDFLNKVLDNGGIVHYYSARGSASGTDWLEFTKNQLKEWGARYTSLKLGKPDIDIIIDDKALNANFFENLMHESSI